MIPHFPGKIRAPPPTTDSGRHTGALRAPWGASLDGQFPLDKTHTRARAYVRAFASVRRCAGAGALGAFGPTGDGRRAPGRRCSGAPCGRLGAPMPRGASLDGQFPLDKTHTRARAYVRAFASVRRCAGAGALGAFGPTGDGRRAPGRRCSGAPCGRLGAPRPRGCSLGLSKGALQALCCAQGARWALLGRSSGARGALVGAPLGRSSGARAGRLLGRSSGARQALSGARAGRSLGRSSSAHQARAGRSFWALLGRSSGAHWALRAIILELHGHSMLRQS